VSIVVQDQIKLHRFAVWLIVRSLASKMGLQKYVLAGSYRRGAWWCNDIDLLIPINSASEGEGIKANLKKLGWTLSHHRKNDNEIVFSTQFLKETKKGIIVLDLFLAPPGSWGNALLFTTGPKSFNSTIRSDILGLGYSWTTNPRFFTRILDNTQISFDNERSALFFINKKWIPPHKRV